MGGFSRDWVKGRFAPGYRDYLSGAAKSGSGLEQRTKSAPVFQSCAAAQRNCNGTRKNPPIKEGLFANCSFDCQTNGMSLWNYILCRERNDVETSKLTE